MKEHMIELLKVWKPIGDRIVVLPEEQQKETDTGLITSNTKQGEDKRIVGTVVAVGPGRWLENGELEPMQSQVGDKVIFGRYAGDDFLIDQNGRIEKYVGVKRDEQILVTIVRQDSLLITLPSNDREAHNI